MVKNIFIDGLDLEGGVLCLDFANTMSDRQHEPGTEYLNNFEDLLYWAEKKAGVISPETAQLLEKAAVAEPERAQRFFKEAMALRELIYGIFYQLGKNQAVDPVRLQAFNETAKLYLPHIQLRQHENHFEEAWHWEAGSIYQITAPVVKTAYDLLLSDKLHRVRECSSNHCGWLFLDTSKNGMRRWCSMKTCGSNDKAIKYYYRKKEAKE
jgi:predicted RNA-binding Zn ribbon-like protein